MIQDAGGAWERVIPMNWFAATMIVDPPRDRLVLFGGQNAMGQTTELWTRSLADSGRWKRVDVAGPKPAIRADGTAIYDPRRDRMIVFGGAFADGVWSLSLAGTPAWTQLALPGSGPGERQGVRAVYDPVGDRMVMFGGYTPPIRTDLWGDVWAFALGDSSGWSQVLPSGAGPSARGDAAVAYDSRRHRILVFSGYDWGVSSPQRASLPDLWALTLDGIPNWVRLSASGDAPPGLYATAATYDSLHDRMVIYGGEEWAVGEHREAWVLEFSDPPVWTRRSSPVAPTPRLSACLAYDERRDRFVMFGGAGSDTWSLSLDAEPTWTLLEPGGQEPASTGYFASSAYDPVQHQSLVLGGFAQYGAEGDWWPVEFPVIWSLTLDSRPRWMRVLPDTAAPDCVGQSMIVDSRQDRLVVFSGADRGDSRSGGLTQLSLEDPQHWENLLADGGPPLQREFHSATYDPVRAQMVVFGGRGPDRVLGDTWMLSLNSMPQWQREDSVAVAPAPRFGHSAIYDPIGDRLIVFGGTIGGACYGDLWQLSLTGTPAWSPFSAGAGPSPRAFAATVYDSRRQRVVLIGGRAQDGTALGDMWFLPLASGAKWVRADSAGVPAGPRWGAVTTYDAGRDAVTLGFGVTNPCGYGYYNDTWLLHPADPVPAVVIPFVANRDPWNVRVTWSQLPSSGCTGTVQRRVEDGAWLDQAAVTPDAGGRVEFVDRSALPGLRYIYRLVWSAGAVASTSAEAQVDVPGLRFALACASANPSREGLRVALSLPDGGPTEIAVYDVAGRQLVRREIGAFGPGDHTVELAARGTLRPGVYLVRMRRSGESLVTRAVVLQ